MADHPRFLFVTCQIGAERAVKAELARRWPEFRFAYSRPGFLTFKLPDHHRLSARFDLESVFARAYGFSLGKVLGTSLDELACGVWKVYGDRPFARIHVWRRDWLEPGERDFEPSITPAATEATEAIRAQCPRGEALGPDTIDPAVPAPSGRLVLDCIMVDPHEWWVGYHRVGSVAGQWPGGIPPLQLPPDAVGRAWLKMEEALQWSQLPVQPGGRWAELGSAPGGSSQSLLDRGMIVTGIDPGEMDARVLAHPHFTHLRGRAAQIRRREFRKVRWIAADMNVAPGYALDAVEAIVMHPEVHVRGLLLTLKLPQWKLAERVPEYLDRVRSWGYNVVRARQLAHNRREICVAALRKPFRRKQPRVHRTE